MICCSLQRHGPLFSISRIEYWSEEASERDDGEDTSLKVKQA